MSFPILRSARCALGLVEKSSYVPFLATAKLADIRNQIITQQNNRQLHFAISTPGLVSVREYSKKYGQKIKNSYEIAIESDSDNEHERRPRAESEFWRRKMRTIHSLLDVNKDGVISFDDFKLLADKFVNVGHLNERETRNFHQCLKELWEAQWGAITPYNLVTVEQYLEDMHHVLNDKQLKKKVHSFLPYLFKAVDKDKSGEISEKEFKLFFQCLGIDEVHAVASFSLIDTNSDGKLNIKEFIKTGRDFFLSEDETRVSKFFWGPLVEQP